MRMGPKIVTGGAIRSVTRTAKTMTLIIMGISSKIMCLSWDKEELVTLIKLAIPLLTKRRRCKRALLNKVTARKIQTDTMTKTTKYLLWIQIWLPRPNIPAKFVDLAHIIWQKPMLEAKSTLIIITHM